MSKHRSFSFDLNERGADALARADADHAQEMHQLRKDNTRMRETLAEQEAREHRRAKARAKYARRKARRNRPG